MTVNGDVGTHCVQPVCGMTLAFKPAASQELADIPARVIEIWPQFRSGDYLVTLEYADSVKLGNEFIQQIEAFMSELYHPNEVPHGNNLQGVRTGAVHRVYYDVLAHIVHQFCFQVRKMWSNSRLASGAIDSSVSMPHN
jgi:hypothetical protein